MMRGGGVYLLCFVAIGWAVLTLSWGQGKLRPASVAWPKVTEMGAKKVSTPIGQPCMVWRNSLQGFSQKVEKCWQNRGGGDGGDGGGGGNGPKTISPPVTRSDLKRAILTQQTQGHSYDFMITEEIVLYHWKTYGKNMCVAGKKGPCPIDPGIL